MKSVHNFTFFNYFDVLLPNFVLRKLYFALPILNIELPKLNIVLPKLNIVLPKLYFALPEHNIRLPMIDIGLHNYIIPNTFLNKTYYLQMYESYFHHI